MVLMLADNPRTAAKAAIKRASAVARAEMDSLDAQALDDLSGLYRRASEDMQAAILQHGDAGGSLRIDVLRDLLQQTNARLQQLELARNDLFGNELLTAARLGTAPFTGATVAADLTRVAHEAVQFVHAFVAEDGLQLSDRLWRLDRHARDAVGQAIESSIIQGHSASRAAQDFLARGQPVPPEIAAKMGLADAGRVARATGESLMTGEGSPYDNARRLFRTEINRAHGEAYRNSAFAHPDVAGTRFLLSPNHPKTDICDMHASVNLYGLGPGVYPKGKSPLPAHPNTLSYEEAVFTDEITAADRAGKQTRFEWLQQQPPGAQSDILGGLKKAQAFRQGVLRENEIGTPWRILKQRYAQRGIEIVDGPRENVATPASVPSRATAPVSSTAGFRPFESVDAAVQWANRRGTALFPGTAKLDALNSGLMGITRVLDPYQIVNTEIAFNRRLPNYVGALAGTSFNGNVKYIRFAPGMNKSLSVAQKKAEEGHNLFLRRRDAEISRLESQITDPARDEFSRAHLRAQLDLATATRRWAVNSDPSVSDPIAATASHEAGHTLYYTKRLAEAWAAALTRHQVQAIDIVQVSKYAATSRSELWAEVTSAMHEGTSDSIPGNILKSYQEVLDAINPVS